MKSRLSSSSFRVSLSQAARGFVTVYTGQTGAFGRTRVLGSRLSAKASFSKASWPPMGVRPSWASGRVRSLSRIWPR